MPFKAACWLINPGNVQTDDADMLSPVAGKGEGSLSHFVHLLVLYVLLLHKVSDLIYRL